MSINWSWQSRIQTAKLWTRLILEERQPPFNSFICSPYSQMPLCKSIWTVIKVTSNWNEEFSYKKIINAVGLYLPGNQSVTLKINLIQYSFTYHFLPLGLNNSKVRFPYISAFAEKHVFSSLILKVSQFYFIYFLSQQGEKHIKHIKLSIKLYIYLNRWEQGGNENMPRLYLRSDSNLCYSYFYRCSVKR